MKTSKVFAMVKQEIKKKNYYHICTATWALWRNNKVTEKEAEKCLQIIQNHLMYHSTYDSWLRHNHKTVYVKQLKSNKGNFPFKQGRIQWLDALIAYYKKQGD